NPLTGRYIESDPLGLAGGSNTYSYSLNDPVHGTDRSGLLVGDAAAYEAVAGGTAEVGGTAGLLETIIEFFPPAAAVVAAAAAGAAIGTLINHFAEESIQSFLTPFLPEEPTTATQLPLDLFEKHKQAAYEKYKERCSLPPPAGPNKCEAAKWRAARARDC